MKSNKIIFLLILVFMIVLSIGSVSADDLTTTDSGVVSGDVEVTAVNPWNTSGELTYDVPANADVKNAALYVNVYSGSGADTYGLNANVSVNDNQIASEQLWMEGNTAKDPTTYVINDHTTKSYSEYQMYYNITDIVKGLNGTSLKINVDSFAMEGKSFDGRIKFIGLVVAYDDGDDDKISYWINSGQSWTNGNCSTIFDTSDLEYIYNAKLIDVGISSSDATYKLNSEFLTDSIHKSGNYYQYNEWDVSNKIILGQSTKLDCIGTAGSYGVNYKNVLAVLKVDSAAPIVNISSSTEYSKTCYAGTNNTLTTNVTVNKDGNYVVKLLADGVVVATYDLNATKDTKYTIYLTDDTIRAVDESTVNGANNTNVNYTVVVYSVDDVIGETSLVVPVLYNGNLGKDLAYPAGAMESYYNATINGDIVIDIKDDSTYMAGAATGRTDVWTITLPDNSNFVDAFIYVSYNWDKSATEFPVFNTTFNGVAVSPVASYRDQSNLGTYGKYGYGVLVYKISDLIAAGENTFVISKDAGLTAVYPSSLIYLYNTTGSNVLKNIYISNGADLLAGTTSNVAQRLVKADSTIAVDDADVDNAMVYIFAASGQAGEGNIVFNGNENVDVWTGSSNSMGVWSADVTSTLKDSNSISFVATGSTILALQQIIVTTEFGPTPVDDYSIKTWDCNYGGIAKVLVMVPDYVTGTVTVSVNGKIFTEKIEDGIAIVLVSGLSAGTYDLDVSYSGDDSYLPFNATKTVTVNPVHVIVTPTDLSTTYDSGKEFQVKVADANNKAVSGLKLTLNVYTGSSYKTVTVTTDANGIAKYSASKLSIATHKVVVNLVDTKNYVVDSKKDSSIKVAKAATTVTAKKVTYKKGAKKYFKVTIKNKATKKVVKSLTLKIKVYTGKKYKTYKVKTNSKGVAKLSTKALKKGTHKVVITTTSKYYTVKKSGKLIKIK